MDAKEACNHAIQFGLKGIVFTDHMDIDFPDDNEFFNIDFNEYNEYMDRLKQEYKNRIDVIKGIEIGIQPHTIEDSEAIASKYDFDYVLASVHVIDGEDPYRENYYEGKTKHRVFSRYLELIYSMVSNCNNFDVAGHFDFIARKSHYEDNTLRYCDFTDLLDGIFLKLIEKGKGLEVNTACYREKPILPGDNFDPELLRRYRELGGEIICIGSDAHRTDHLGCKLKEFNDILKGIGFKYTTIFKHRKPVYLNIE